jgi:uncharacterized lipoprotein YajG
MNSIRRIAVSVVSIAAFACLAGCGTSTKEVDSTTYVPAPAQAVVQAPPVVAVTPPTTITSTSVDKSRDSSVSSTGEGTVDSSSSHHSESTTVTPSN